MKRYLLTILFLPMLSNAGTLGDFFKSNPELDNNIAIHSAISKSSRFEAAGYARREGGDEGKLMDDKGDQFAVLGFRRVKNACKYPEAAAVMNLSESDCAIVLKKDI
ncbi:hypothetical protein ID10_08585 [Pantoea agglomerans]|uniref:hypothetical protein n=1 Tax=Enterobacter agglomerans TaxID=549 RepID=UPI0005106037|nr:hypothetical protein [Pantoea agglomerans]KGD79751.1 hypothetical protein ID10_08585 [Pantoea agglomerans]